MLPLVMAGKYRAVVKFTGADVTLSPASLNATAVNVWAPIESVAEMLYGLLMSLPTAFVPSKNCTFVTVPLVGTAVACISVAAELGSTALLVGLVTVTLIAG